MQPETSEELLRHLEALTGRRFRSRQDIDAYLRELAAFHETHAAQVMRRSRKVKHMVLAFALALAFLQYYWMDALYQVASLRDFTVFVAHTPRS